MLEGIGQGHEVSSVIRAQPALDTTVILHQARSALLREMPRGACRLLSAGCAGGWYFDWVEKCYGHVAEHIGIEFYSAPPDVLPPNVTWFVNTASNMEAAETDSCDLVFSGQNLEHLWADEVSGFLSEAARVLKVGGHLVVDSPNRDLTRRLNWSHPEHTVEFTVPEIHRLLELGGFDITKKVGVWLCRDPKSGRMLPFDANVPDIEWSMVERLVAATSHPEHSFLWWLEGQRSGREPDRAAIDALLSEAYEEAWPERVQRLLVAPGRQIETQPDGDWIIIPPAAGGVAMFGPYMPLRAGRHRVTFNIIPDPGSSGVIAVCDVCVFPDATILQQQEVTGDMNRVMLEVELKSQAFGGQFRCFSRGGGFKVHRKVTLEEALT